MSTLKELYKLAAPYWLNRKHWFSWVLLVLCLALNLVMVEITVWLNEWNKEFYDALGALQSDLIYTLLIKFCGLVAVIVLLSVHGTWLQQLVEIRWRTWLTERLVNSWLSNKSYYRMTLGNEPDNPDQRITEDARILVDSTLGLFLGGVRTVSTLLSFSIILWNLSGNISFSWNDSTFNIPGYLFWVALVYSILGTAVTHFFGNPLQKLNFEQQRREANFRASLLRKRDNAEQIALINGEKAELRVLKAAFEDITSNWFGLINREKKLGVVVSTYGQIATMMPLFAGIPALIAKTVTLGGLFQVRSAFMRVYGALSWFVFRYKTLMHLSATVERLSQFTKALGQ